MDQAALKWTRHQAAERGISVSRFLGEILNREMLGRGAAYQHAFETWKQLSEKGLDIDAAHRLTREQAHERH